MIRTIDNWIEIYSKLPSPSTESVEKTIARRILGDLTGYRDNSGHKEADALQLAQAMQAYARMLHQHGVVP